MARGERTPPERTRRSAVRRSVAKPRAKPADEPAGESTEAFLEQLLRSEENADRWIERIARDGAHPGLLMPPIPHWTTVHALVARIGDRIESEPELAETVALAALALDAILPQRGNVENKLPADALRVLAAARRVRGDLDAAEAYFAQVRVVLPRGYTDPASQAETLIEEAELLAARRRFPEAIAKGREALEIYSSPIFTLEPRTLLLRKISSWAAVVARPRSGPFGKKPR